MKVIVDDKVVKAIDDFYIAAMSRHISLSEETVMAKKKRLIASLESLKDYYFIYPKARWKDEWIKKQLAGFYLRGLPFRIRGGS